MVLLLNKQTKHFIWHSLQEFLWIMNMINSYKLMHPFWQIQTYANMKNSNGIIPPENASLFEDNLNSSVISRYWCNPSIQSFDLRTFVIVPPAQFLVRHLHEAYETFISDAAVSQQLRFPFRYFRRGVFITRYCLWYLNSRSIMIVLYSLVIVVAGIFWSFAMS